MKRNVTLAGVAIVISVFMLVAVALVGCGNDESGAGSSNTATGPTMPSTVPRPGMPTPGVPMAAPPIAAGEPTQVGQIPFSKAPITSVVTPVTVKVQGVTLSFLKFKYVDSNGKARVCQLPDDEAKSMRTPSGWISTFEVYSAPVVEKAAPKGKAESSSGRVSGFPFVSPPPAEPPGR